MKVLLTIWISAILIQEVIPNTLVRLPREGEKKPSVVQTEYEAKYEQKGKLGNESYGKVSGKHEIVHDNCGDNWNSFADKCATLIKDLVASLANAVSSKPGDATNLQVQIKNTFRHFDNTHNCTCLNHTGKKLSDIDLSPIFQNLSTSTMSSVDPSECEREGQDCKRDDSEVKEGERSENGSNTNDQSAGQSCHGQNDGSKMGKNCGSGAGVTEASEKLKQTNCELVEGDSQVNPETAEGSEDQLNNNCRRQATHPKFSTMKPQTEFSSSSYSSSNSLSNSKVPDKEKSSLRSTSAPYLSEQPKYPFVAPNPSSQSPKFKISATASPVHSSSHTKILPSSDSQFLDSPNTASASQTLKPYGTSTDQKNPKNTILRIPQRENEKKSEETNQGFITTTPVSSQSKITIITPVTIKQSTRSSHGSAHDGNEPYSYTSPIPRQSKATVITPVTTKESTGSSRGSAHDGNGPYSYTSPIPGQSDATVAPVTIKESTGSRDGSAHDGNEPYSYTSLIPGQSDATVLTSVTTKESTGSSRGSAHDGNEPHFYTSLIPGQSKATVITPVTTKESTGSRDGSAHDGNGPYSYTSPIPGQSDATVAPVTIKESTGSRDGSAHDGNGPYSYTSLIPGQSDATVAPVTTKESTGSSRGSAHDGNGPYSYTSPIPRQSKATVITPVTTKESTGSRDGSAHDGNGPYSYTSLIPGQSDATVAPVTIKESTGSRDGSAHDGNGPYSYTSPIPGQSDATVITPATTKESTGSRDGSAHDGNEPYSYTSLIPGQSDATVITPATTKESTGSSRGSAHDGNEPYSYTSLIPGQSDATVITPVTTKESTGSRDGSAHDGNGPYSYISPIPGQSDATVAPVTIKESTGSTHNSSDSFSLTTPVLQPSESEENKRSTENNRNKKESTSTTPIPNRFKTTIPITTKQPTGSADSSGADDQKLLNTSKKPISPTYYSGPYIAIQQERPTIYVPTASPQDDSGDQSQYAKTSFPITGSLVTAAPTKSQQQSIAAPVIVKPSQPGALIPGGQPHPNDAEDQDSSLLQPTTFQTTSVEPTTPNAYLPLTENPKNSKPYLVTASLPTDTHKTISKKPSTSPKTTETQDDDDEDDEEDCCSCESCTEEEITDPKLYKENACKNLEEARRELKVIFNKIKKKLNCGRKAP